jgi:hypothetical protein
MPIRHKFYRTDFGNGYSTHNAILDKMPYKPEVMFLGTFNPDTPNANFADFYYGRNFFWTAFKNLIISQGVVLQNRRMPQNGNPPAVLNPTILEIFKICSTLKITFSDLVLEIFNEDNDNFELLQNDNVIFNGQEFNLIQDGLKDNVGGLQQLNNLGQIRWNTQNIIKYLCDNPQIKSIYFTRRPTGIWAEHWNEIVNHKCMSGRLLINVFTPSGQGKPVFHSMTRLLNHWLHNDNPNFGKLDNEWLENNGVNINNY